MMRKRLISVLSIATLTLGGCSGNWMPDTSGWVPDWDAPDWIPGIHKVDINQGNVITQEMVNNLRPGMTKRQVRFVMGTPLITDTFLPNRWDYVYRKHDNGKKPEQFRITLTFEKGALSSFNGDLRPLSIEERAANPEPAREHTVLVPLEPSEEPGIFDSLLDSVGLSEE